MASFVRERDVGGEVRRTADVSGPDTCLVPELRDQRRPAVGQMAELSELFVVVGVELLAGHALDGGFQNAVRPVQCRRPNASSGAQSVAATTKRRGATSRAKPLYAGSYTPLTCAPRP